MFPTSLNHDSQRLDPQNQGVSADGITHLQEQQIVQDRLPKSLIEWLTRINRRYLVLNEKKTNDTR